MGARLINKATIACWPSSVWDRQHYHWRLEAYRSIFVADTLNSLRLEQLLRRLFAITTATSCNINFWGPQVRDRTCPVKNVKVEQGNNNVLLYSLLWYIRYRCCRRHFQGGATVTASNRRSTLPFQLHGPRHQADNKKLLHLRSASGPHITLYLQC